MKTIFILFTTLISVHLTLAQNSYILEGSINADTGTMLLMIVGTPSLYPSEISDITAPVKNGKFVFKGRLNNPLAYAIAHKVNGQLDYMSGMFFVEKGTQHIICNIDSMRVIPAIENRTTMELRAQYTAALAPTYTAYEVLDSKRDSLRKAYQKHIPSDITAKLNAERSDLKAQMDNVFMGYAKQHPNSYVVLWKIADRLSNGYKPVLDSAYSILSGKLRGSYTGKAVAIKLKAAKGLNVGSVFPTLTLRTTRNELVRVPTATHPEKYKLIDFWFTHCPACIAQFPKLKQTYAVHHKNGFEIIAISTDDQKNVLHWQKMIAEGGMEWHHYLDLNGVHAQELSITAFPTNYLVDEKGVVLKRNITPDELEVFLVEKGL